MTPQTPHHGLAGNQRGFVLIFALLVLVTLTFLGFMAVRTAVMENTLAGNERVRREAFSLADGGTAMATRMLQENIDCPTGFPAYLLAQGTGAIQFPVSAAFTTGTTTDAGTDYRASLPADVTAALAAAQTNPAALYDISVAPRPEIFRQFCIEGEGTATAAGGGCNPASAGAPHTNILYHPDPNNQGAKCIPGESCDATGANAGQGYNHNAGGTSTNVNIYSQHVAYQGGGVTTRESIILIMWAQPNNGKNNCRWP